MSVKSRLDKLEQVIEKQIGSKDDIDYSLVSSEDLDKIIASTDSNEINLILSKYKNSGSNKVIDKNSFDYSRISEEDLNKIGMSTDANEILQIANKYKKTS